MGNQCRRLLIAAPGSGHGKTLLTCGILRAFQKQLKKVAAFKCGPDYIDPMFHEQVLHTKSKNLDPYFTGRSLTRALFVEDAKGADLSVVEGVMGYYDGIAGISTEASSYHLADILEAPVILTVDGSGSSVSVCALIKGFLSYRTPSHIAGIVLNKTSKAMYKRLKELIEKELGIPVCGYLPKMAEVTLESRHLGLVLPGGQKKLEEKLRILEQQCLETLDLEMLWEISGSVPEFDAREEKVLHVAPQFANLTVAVAKDEAFCFYYKDNLRLLEKLGARLVYFSPLKDEKLPPKIDGLLLGGGYPELYAEELSENKRMRKSIYQALKKGLPCIAECGGFLYLKESLTSQQQQTYAMCGVLKGGSQFTGKLSRFGYVELEAQDGQLLGERGMKIKGHEFHYMETTDNGESFLARKPKSERHWKCVHGTPYLYAGFPHLYWYANPKAAEGFLQRMEEQRQ